MRLNELSRKKVLRIVGIMNGTSIDGIDFVLCDVIRKNKDVSIRFVDQAAVSFDAEIQKNLRLACQNNLAVEDLATLHHDLGRVYRDQLKKISKQKKWSFEAIGLHGQTVFHAPPKATLQIGEASYLSETFQVPVISDFRVADLALKGQGAPIASLFHQIVYHRLMDHKRISLHNLGGISNLSLINSKGVVEKAFDTGPANMLIDLLIQKNTSGEFKYDKNGQWASRGIPAQTVVDHFLESDQYFTKAPPKSCGREQFGEGFLSLMLKQMKNLNDEDRLATVTELTARSVASAYQKFSAKLPSCIILCGGGAKNIYLKKRIQYHLPKVDVVTTENFGWPVSAVEGAAFALLAAYKIWGLPSNLPKTTGAKKSVPLGKVVEVF